MVCELLARRGHQRCHCNEEEGSGTLSRQLGNDESYRSSCVGVSGCFTVDDPLKPHDTYLSEDDRAVRIPDKLRQAEVVLATIQKLG